ncbi:MAG: hypothetical protein LBF83_03855 [Spirochaetaceae bacterium]|jgi:hypothetical protein|nr:hypothetical protein [Spirochaetaceae bacterium]
MFYMFWLTLRPENSNSAPFLALLTGGAAAVVRFFVPAMVDAYGFGLSRFVSAFIDHTTLPVLFPLIAALLISRVRPESRITDFTGFILLAMMPVSLVYSVSRGVRHDVLRLVLTPLLWTALAAGFYPFIRLFSGRFVHKTAAIFGMAVFSLLPPLVWFDFFRQNYFEGAALLFAALAPTFALCVYRYRKKAGGGRVESASNN